MLSEDYLKTNPKHAPVRVEAGALGVGIPDKTLYVSPQHRILVRSEIVEIMFSVSEILVPAAQLAGIPSVKRLNVSHPVQYFHILMDKHSLLRANETLVESLYLGTNTMSGLTRMEHSLISRLVGLKASDSMQPVRKLASGSKVKKLVERHLKNNRQFVENRTNFRPKEGVGIQCNFQS